MRTIGELAAEAGVTVKTVRFYSDRGLLPEASRSAGGHRRYGPEALDRLRLIRSLRALDLPVPDVGRVLDSAPALEDVVAARLREVGTRLTALRWREAALQLLHDAPPGERADRLRLIGTATTPPDTAALARFWRLWLPPRLPASLRAEVVDRCVPQPPADPAPAHVLAFARLHALVRDARPGKPSAQPAAHRPGGGRPDVLYAGLIEAFDLTSPSLRAGRPPGDGEALDRFVAAHADGHGTRDTPAYRSRLGGLLDAEPRIDRYWQLVSDLQGPAEPTPGDCDTWLRTALARHLAATSR
ncbi:MerR family transcriptional regulator [Streptomyces sp. DSM 42041]|uniref:MerR family transcriptional regulator n=1 Tax=Streptomyces hazeniae TaxID=3075538 RepID=A0ABU2NXP2_9ACTN|nr:MerR family transcriptional regulator [Streptomyces sp. DSM 42041]MDT0380403.1 MerR family transcriptional regulator [Streptomyces sp. DSM 42041]